MTKEGIVILAYILVFVIIIFYLLRLSYVEHFMIQEGTTRLMSYDIRGDIPVRRTYTGPWMNPEVYPIYNRPLII